MAKATKLGVPGFFHTPKFLRMDKRKSLSLYSHHARGAQILSARAGGILILDKDRNTHDTHRTYCVPVNM